MNQRADDITDSQILSAMIRQRDFLVRCLALPPNPFESPFANRIAKWCLDYVRQYNEAPNGQIQTIFNDWARKADGATVHLVEKVLQNLSETDVNVDRVVDLAERRFNEIALRKLRDKIESAITTGETSAGLEFVSEFKRISLSSDLGRNPFVEEEVMLIAFRRPPNDLFTFPEPARFFFEGQFCEECFVGIQAPEKRGKTWWLLEMAFRALRQKCKVALFEAGDMTERQIIHRFAVRITGIPNRTSYCGDLDIPESVFWKTNVDLKGNVNRIVETTTSKETISDPLNWQKAYVTTKQFMDRFADKGKNFMLACHPNNTLTVSGINSTLDVWEREKGFVPNVVLIDYADLLVPESGYKEFRHQTDTLWRALRRISQERKCLVITATQANKEANRIFTQDQTNVSEDKRKNAHVTAMLALNQSPIERDKGIFRLNWTVLREGAMRSPLLIAGNLRIGRPFIVCNW